MGDAQQKPPEVVFAAIEPIWRKAISTCNFYWEMAWRPRLFAEEHLQTPTASSLKRAVLQTVGLAGCWSLLLSLGVFVADLIGAPNFFSSSGKTLDIFKGMTAATLQVIPLAGMLWLLTRRYSTSISQALMIEIYTFNIFMVSTFLVLTVIGAVAATFGLIVYCIEFLPTAKDVHSFGVWFSSSPYWPWVLALFIIFHVACFCVWGRVLLFIAPNLVAGTIGTSYWQGLWRFLVSLTVGIIPYAVMLWLYQSFVVPTISPVSNPAKTP
jgi:hypothetical protein